MRGRLDASTRFPEMRLLVDFNNLGFSQMENWEDITDYILEINGSTEKESEFLGGVSSDIINIKVDNTENVFSNNNSNSPYYQKVKGNLKFVLKTGFKGEALTDYMVGYIKSFTPHWRDGSYSIVGHDPIAKLKKVKSPKVAYQGVTHSELVHALLDEAGIDPYFVRDIPETEYYFNYFKFEEEYCFESMKRLMEIVAGQVFCIGNTIKSTSKLALNYVWDTNEKHDIIVDDLHDFEENVDLSFIINKISVISEHKEIAPLQVLWETPENLTKVENETSVYDGSGYLYIKPTNLPLYYDNEHDITIKNLTNGQDVTWSLWNAELGRVTLDTANITTGDVLSISYNYQSLVIMPNDERRYVATIDTEVASFLSPDVVAWNQTGTSQIEYSDTPDDPNTLSLQSFSTSDGGRTVEIVLKNNTAGKVSISTLQFRGYPIKVLNPIEVYNSDAPSINEYDVSEISISNNYINNVQLAEKISEFLIDNNAQPKKRITIKINGYPELLLNDIAKVVESESGTNHKFTIERIDASFSVSNGWTATLNLVELDSEPWVYTAFTGESFEKTHTGLATQDFIEYINANLIDNGGAELWSGANDEEDPNAIGGVHNIPEGWSFTRLTGDASARVRVGGNYVLHGRSSFEVTTTSSGEGYFSQMIEGVKPSTAFTASVRANVNGCTGYLTVEEYTSANVFVNSHTVVVDRFGDVSVSLETDPSTDKLLVKIGKNSGGGTTEEIWFDMVKLEEDSQSTPYIESEDPFSVRFDTTFANSVTLGNEYGIQVTDDTDNLRVMLGQYAPNEYGLKIFNGAIEIENGLPSNQVNVGSDSNFENGYDPSTKVEFYYGTQPPADTTLIWVDTTNGEDILKRWHSDTSTWEPTASGPQGPAGEDGQSLYTWVKYATDDQGSNMSDSPDGMDYIGLAYNKTTSVMGVNPSDYTWSKIQGAQGVAGADGTTFYTYIKYADDAQGTGITDDPTGKNYLGISYGNTSPTESIDPNDYMWSKIVGPAGADGYTPVKGVDYFDGVDGQDGADGVSSYLWIRYSQNSDGSNFTTDPTGALYIGTATTTVSSPPLANTDYNWTLIKGEQGIAGETGADGQTSYLHIKYSNDGGTTFTGNGGEDVGAWIGTYVDFNQADSSNTNAYTWNKVKGEDGYTPVKGVDYFDGQDGQDGTDGTSAYLWIRYSQNSNGSNMTTDPTGAIYIGTTTTTTASAPSSYTSYNWTKIKGEQGVQGETGSNGQTSYLHIKYSNDGGSTFTGNNGEDVGDWIGTYVDFNSTDSSSPSAYTWNKVKGEDGYTPIKGVDYFDGQDGQDGADGTSSYLWVRYSQNSNGNPLTTDPTGAKYVGIATTTTPSAPTSYTAYDWSLIKGTDGVAGEDGSDGQTSYLHIKYSNDGGSTFTANNGETVGDWIGTYVDFNSADSLSVSAYTWNKVKGEQGEQGPQGPQGIQGPAGADGQTYWTWIKYADSPTSGMSDNPTGKEYIGIAHNKISSTESSNYADYTWAKIKGEQGIAGTDGTDGTTTYTWVKYADDENGTGMSNSPDGKIYLGLAYNKTTATESSNPADYAWSPLYDIINDYGNVKVFNKLAGITAGSGTTGSLVIHTPITLNNYMTRIDIKGYMYTGNTELDVSLGFYSYTNANFPNKSFFNKGDYKVSQVRLGTDSSGKVVIIIDPDGSTWSYPKIVVERAQIGHTQPPDSFKNGWSMAFETDLSVYSNLVAVPKRDIEDTTGSQQKADDAEQNAKDHANNKDTTIRQDLKLDAPLPTDITMNGSGITASSSGGYARLDYRGLYIYGGAIQIDGGLPDGQIASSSTWHAKETPSGAQAKANSAQTNAINHANSNDSSLRNDLSLTAPLPNSITMNGNGITASATGGGYARLDYRGLYISGGAIQISGGLPQSQLDLTTSSKINNGNSAKTIIDSKNGLTYIDSSGIYTGKITFDQAEGGTLQLGGPTTDYFGYLSVLDTNGSQIGSITEDGANFPRLTADEFISPSVPKFNTDSYRIMVDPINGDDSRNGTGEWTDTDENGPLKSLSEALNKIPRFNNGTITIQLHYSNSSNVNEGTMSLNGITGSGKIIIDGQTNSNRVNGYFEALGCTNEVQILDLTFNHSGYQMLYLFRCNSVRLERVIFYGNNSVNIGLLASRSTVDVMGCQFYEMQGCIRSENAMVWVHVCEGLGSEYALYARYNGRIGQSGTKPAGGVTHLKEESGGEITGSASLSYGNATPPPAPSTTDEWTATDARTWHYDYNVWDDYYGATPTQGKWNSSGRYTGFWFFGSSLSNAVTGKTIEKIQVYIERQGSGGNSGDVTHYIRWHGHTSKPTTPSDESLSTEDATISLSTGEGGWVTLPTSFHADFENGSAKGIGVFTSSTSNSLYSRLRQNAKIKITYS